MNFTVDFSEDALVELKRHKKSGQKILLNKIQNFVEECQTDPREGTGKPKQLKHYLAETWSRKISDQHRFVYSIENDFVQILSVWGHYDDK